MADIVDWLRAVANCDVVIKGDALRAADEIEQLRSDNASLRAALQTQAEEAAKHNAWLSQVHGLCFDLGIAPGHIEDRLFEAIGRVNMLIEQRDELLRVAKRIISDDDHGSYTDHDDIKALRAAIKNYIF